MARKIALIFSVVFFAFGAKLGDFAPKGDRKEIVIKKVDGAKKELNEVTAEMARLKTQQIEFKDKVDRTMVKSSVTGIVQKLFVHTVGGVVKPGADLVEIVPTSNKLFLEIKIGILNLLLITFNPAIWSLCS